MSYLARLVEQTGLSVAGREPRSAVPPLPKRTAWGEALEEVSVEQAAPPPLRSDAPPDRRVRMPEAPDPVEARAEPQKPKAPAPDTPRQPPRDPAPEISVSQPSNLPLAASPEAPAPHEPKTRVEDVSVEVTRHETLRRVIEWVSANEAQPAPPKAEPTEVVVTREATPPPPEPPALRPPKIEIADPAPRQPRPEPKTERRVVPSERVQIVDARQPEPPPRKEAPAPREERVEISIGAINLTLEAPPKPPPAPSPAIAAPPAPPPPAAARPAPLSSNRLRRRFIRV